MVIIFIAIDGYNAYKAEQTTGVRKGSVIGYVRNDYYTNRVVLEKGKGFSKFQTLFP